MATIEDIKLELTCSACPEQYDAFIDGRKVGYLRLRHGRFTAEAIDQDGRYEEVYYAATEGDGIFESDERDVHLSNAKLAIDAYHRAHSPENGGMVQVVMSWSMRALFEQWLDAGGQELFVIPGISNDDLPTYGVRAQ